MTSPEPPSSSTHPRTGGQNGSLRARAGVVAVVCAAAAFVWVGPRDVAAQTGTPPESTTLPAPVVTESTTTSTSTTLPVAATIPATTVPAPTVPASTVATVPSAAPISPDGLIVATPSTEAAPTSTPDGSTTAVEETTSTSSTSSTSSTIESTTTTSFIVDPNSVDLMNDGDISEPPPNIGIPVLPPPKVPARNPTLEKLLSQLTVQQQKLAAVAQGRADEAALRLAKATKEIESLQERAERASQDLDAINTGIEELRLKLRERALAVFAGGSVADIDFVLGAESPNDFARNADLIGRAQEADNALIAAYRSQIASAQDKTAEVAELVERKALELEVIQSEQQALGDALLKVQEQLANISSGAAIALGGFVFPVGTPFSFWDGWGQPRMMGTALAHWHQGTDIMAPEGTPLYAVSRGVITKVGQNRLGGNRLWLIGADGTEYYYAHLSAFAEGIHDGSFVEAGDVVGFCGSTGNAKGGAAHLHFEIHPGGGAAVNPYPFLDAVRRTDVGALLRASQAATATTVPVTIPGQIRAGIGLVKEVSLAESVAAGYSVVTTTPGSPPPTAFASSETLPYRPVPTAG